MSLTCSTISTLIKVTNLGKGFKAFIGSTGDSLYPVTALMALRGNRPGILFQWNDQI